MYKKQLFASLLFLNAAELNGPTEYDLSKMRDKENVKICECDFFLAKTLTVLCFNYFCK